ncbi:MAG: ribonuclease P protein component [Bacteroidales bacterium]|nr:ribonuclease P protein component [Candidatus Cacconaster merdequi]
MLRNNILSLFKNGKVIYRYPLRATFISGKGDVIVSVPKRLFKRAVKRNLLKRRIREAFRHNSDILRGASFDIFFYYTSPQIESYERISESVSAILTDMVAGTVDKGI